MQILKLVAVGLILWGCQAGPSYQSPAIKAPSNWKHEHCEDTNPDVAEWWEVFQDEKLNQLETLAVSNNPSLFAALERVNQARALAGVAKADLYPQVSLNPNFLNQGILQKIFLLPTTLQRQHQIQNMLPLNINYELDIWGFYYSNYQRAYYLAEAADEDFRTALLILTTDLADSYYRARTLDTQIDQYAETIVSRRKALAINTSRYEGKIVNYSDVSRAQLELSNAEAYYYEAIRMRNIEENRLALLLGLPASEFNLEHLPLPMDPPSICAGVPSDALLRRPDIAAQERVMASRHAEVRQAYASYFPSFSLTGTVGYSSPDLKHFLKWKSRYWAYGGSAYEPIIDGGRINSYLALAWARFAEADFDYQNLVLVAFQEVEDALTSIEYLAKEAEKLAESVTASKKTYRVARDRYFAGLTFYLDVADAERDELEAERAYASAQGLRYSAVIHLIKALGGSWNTYDSSCPVE